jgi:hypothetical protein
LRHFTNSLFWKSYDRLPVRVRRKADKSYNQLVENPNHPSLNFKRVGRYWSARITDDIRAVAVEDDGDFIWFWIGKHSEYDKLIS